MAGSIPRITAASLLFWLVGSAAAQPSAPATGETQDAYPAELSRRPLVLPSGMFEGEVRLNTFSWTGDVAPPGYYVASTLDLRIGAGPVELGANMQLKLREPESSLYTETLIAARGSARVRVAPNNAVELQLTKQTPTDPGAWLANAGYLGRLVVGPQLAVIAGGGVSYQTSAGDTTSDYHITSLTGRAGALAQLAPMWGLRANVRLVIPVEDSLSYSSDIPAQTSLDVQLVYATRHADLYLGFGIDVQGDYGQRRFVAGIAARLP